MKVKAKKLGFYKSKKIRIGDIFEIETEAQFSSRWMEKIDSPSIENKKRGRQKKIEGI